MIIVILAIVLPLTLKKGGHDNPSPPPVIYSHYNPYSTKESKNLQSNMSGIISAPAQYDHTQHLHALNNIIPTNKDGTKKLGIDSKGIPKGANNKFA